MELIKAKITCFFDLTMPMNLCDCRKKVKVVQLVVVEVLEQL